MFAKCVTVAGLAIALGLASTVVAADETTAKANGCLACHSIEKKLVGPSFKSIASRFKGDAHAIDELAKAVRTGSKGVWGSIAMPAQPKISDADLKKVLNWVLAQ